MKKGILFALVILFFSIKMNAQNYNIKTGSAVSEKDAALILDHHNKVRKALGIPPLTWNPEISSYAQEWANYLVTNNDNKLSHRSWLGKNKRAYGENLFWGHPYDYYSVLSASESWYSEKEDYIYQPLSNSNFHETGHYSQMIWNTTKEMGVGVARGSDGGIIVVANYFPAGNIIGFKPY